MQITRIASRKGRQRGRTIYVDGQRALAVSEETFMKMGLSAGDEVTGARLNEILRAERLMNARAAALRLLARRPRSIRETYDRLRRKHFARGEIETVINDLKNAGLLDDERFTRMYLRDQLTLRPSGPRYLKQKLRTFGIPSDLVEKALDELTASTSEEETARDAATSYLRKRNGGKTDPRTLQNRLSGFLARRGFSWESIRAVLRDLPHEDLGNEIE